MTRKVGNLTYKQLEDCYKWADGMVRFTKRDHKLADTVMLLATECYDLKLKFTKIKNKKVGK